MKPDERPLDENYQDRLFEYDNRPLIHSTLCRLYRIVTGVLAFLIRRRSIGRVGWFQ